MNLSLDEYRALVAKAFRGVGYPWGLTEDASWAARRLAELDGSSPAAVVGLLDQLASRDSDVLGMPEADWTSANEGVLCPVCVGTSLLDRGVSDLDNPLSLGRTFTPELLVPFVFELLGSGTASFVVEWPEGASHITAQNTVFYGDITTMTDSVTITRATQSEDHGRHLSGLAGRSPCVSGQSNNRVILDIPLVQRLEQLAHRTYAPATDASRAGAGAGTTDND